MATYTIPAKDPKFIAKLNSIRAKVTDPKSLEKLNDPAYIKQEYNKYIAKKNNPPANITWVVWKASEPEWTTKVVWWVTYKVVWWRYVPQSTNKITNDISQAKQNLNKAEEDRKNKIESWVTDIKEKQDSADAWSDVTYNSDWFTTAMEESSKTFEDLNKATAEQKNLQEKEYAKLAEEKLKSILDPLMDKYNENTAQFTQILDQAMEQNKISIANQRKIADSFKEAAWVEALIAWSKIWPWMSESQIQALWKDITMWFQKWIAEAEWNYEQARINGWNNLKALWMDWKMAQDALLTVTERLWLAAAEPYLLALANSKTNLTDVLDKVNELKTGTQKEAYLDAQKKWLTDEAYKQYEVQWNNANDAQKKTILLNAIPASMSIDADVVNKIIQSDKNWTSVYQKIWSLANLSEQARVFALQAIAWGKMSVDEAMKLATDTWKFKWTDVDKLSTWNLTTQDMDLWRVETPVTPTSQTDLSKMTNTVNTTKEDKAIQTAKTNVNASYEKYIAWLKPNDKAMLDKVKTLSPAKKTEAINRINNSDKSKEAKAALIYYINK